MAHIDIVGKATAAPLITDIALKTDDESCPLGYEPIQMAWEGASAACNCVGLMWQLRLLEVDASFPATNLPAVPEMRKYLEDNPSPVIDNHAPNWFDAEHSCANSEKFKTFKQ